MANLGKGPGMMASVSLCAIRDLVREQGWEFKWVGERAGDAGGRLGCGKLRCGQAHCEGKGGREGGREGASELVL